MTLWLLGDQLNPDIAHLADADRVLLVEAHAFADRHPYHPAKLTLLFSAMRHVRDELRDDGHEVHYVESETFGEGLDEHFEEYPEDELTLMRSASRGSAERFEELVTERDGSLDVVDNDLWHCSSDEFDAWADERSGRSRAGAEEGGEGDAEKPRAYQHENFYRHRRRETGVLMDGDDPEGGEWNYDDENQEFPPEDWEPPEVPRFDPDEATREVHEWVTERFDTWGNPDLDAVVWPVTRDEALAALDDFVENRLGEFGPYQDAMLDDEWALCHSLLSTSLNLGLLRAAEVVDRAVGAYEAGDAPLNSVEGFVRQLVGWREFVRHVYRREPQAFEGDLLDRDRDLPAAYYDGDTEMRCLRKAVENVWERGYAHHIERLMVLSNFATVYGADPHELDHWFHFGFVDAFSWVTTPNVVGMGTWATDVLSSKPYVSSANYVNRMSDHCANCRYDPDETTGEDACPFNALYWSFLRENEETLRGTGRMGLVYHHVDNKDDDEWDAIGERVEHLYERFGDDRDFDSPADVSFSA
ncbi:cryptochrome/photolyase family protein [Halobium salinum]|uniref:Cryptochrome/photolyase family protein n=1 Tax=Halobium salinum TaxID=1364940 RepID=A0ABD5P7R1_9EURY|nr:cryptochrome/photolyase family protein [Halobium salinum]